MSVCNPGVLNHPFARSKSRQYAAGLRCDNSHYQSNERPTGVLRISLGAITSVKKINDSFSFIEGYLCGIGPLGFFFGPNLCELGAARWDLAIVVKV